MAGEPPLSLNRLGPSDLALMDGLLSLFAEAFEEPETYRGALPSAAYLERLLAREEVIALVATADAAVVGGLVAYELRKFEQERSEIYIYDLAVAARHRRRGTATKLIREVQRIAADIGAHVIFIQADGGDTPAISLYSKFGPREDVHHFDIPVGNAG